MFRLRKRAAASFWAMTPADATRIAFQVVVGREPGDVGRATYEPLLAGEMTNRQLVNSLLATPEFAIRLNKIVPVGNEAPHQEEPLVVPLEHGGVLHVASWDLVISGVIRDTGQWEPHITALLRRILGEGSLFVDVGANVGYFTVLGAQLVGSTGRVIAFEPAPVNVQLLLGSLVANSFEHVDVWPLALSDRPAVLGLHTDPVSTNACVAPAGDQATTWVVAVPGDSILDRLDHDGPCVLKVDVEGHEYPALIGLDRFLEARRPTLVLEFNPTFIGTAGGDADRQLAWLFDRFPHVGVVEPDGTVEATASPAVVIERWRLRNEVTGQEGALHLDLVAAHQAL